uniref:Uncharacterized protein n=1 Tax=Pipistrellus kuhlii TaxID=59472 RepID=A0A7J7VBD7_PIPKU|nr:hypothetical protein mPipKuh1_008474 [Pipistrellus kuhlii]
MEMKPAHGLTAPKLQSVLERGSVCSELVLSPLHHALGNGIHIVLSSAVFHLRCQKHFFWVSIVFMIIFLNDYMIFLPMLMYPNVNQALKHRMLIYNFFFLMLGIEWSIVRLLHSPFPHCPLKEAIRPTQMEPCEGLQLFGEHVALDQ